VKVDDDDAAAGLERLRQAPVIGGPVFNVVKDVAEEDGVDGRRRQLRVIGAASTVTTLGSPRAAIWSSSPWFTSTA
jgi:hypothetical protein